MTGIELGSLVFIGLIALLALRVHIGVAMLLAGSAGYVALSGLDPLLNYFKSAAYTRFSVYDLSVVPLFLLMGQFATQGGISKALFGFASAVMSRFKAEAVDSNPVTVTATAAEIRLESEEALAGAAGKELVGYIALQTGTGVQRIADGVDSTRRNYTMTGTFTNAVVLAEEQTAKQTDPGIVQIGSLSGNTVTLFFDEDQSAGLDTSHGKEDLGIVGLSAGILIGVGMAILGPRTNSAALAKP